MDDHFLFVNFCVLYSLRKELLIIYKYSFKTKQDIRISLSIPTFHLKSLHAMGQHTLKCLFSLHPPSQTPLNRLCLFSSVNLSFLRLGSSNSYHFCFFLIVYISHKNEFKYSYLVFLTLLMGKSIKVPSSFWNKTRFHHSFRSVGWAQLLHY